MGVRAAKWAIVELAKRGQDGVLVDAAELLLDKM
jgi:hypothetical protein